MRNEKHHTIVTSCDFHDSGIYSLCYILDIG